ncbi:P-loop nucleotide/nucleoside kinase family protein [Flindersiella endophytica]
MIEPSEQAGDPGIRGHLEPDEQRRSSRRRRKRERGQKILEPQSQKVNYSEPADENVGTVGLLKGHLRQPPYFVNTKPQRTRSQRNNANHSATTVRTATYPHDKPQNGAEPRPSTEPRPNHATDSRRHWLSFAAMLFQIDGLSGTGKTTLCAELSRRGLRAIDADAVFAYVGDPVTGRPSEVDIRANWIWDGQKLRAFAAGLRTGPVFVCGGAMNQDQFADLFTKRFTLRIDSETMRHRLLTRTNNDFGKDPAELAEQLELNARVVEDAERTGCIVVDATRPVEEVADEIVRMAS